jgi:hypothetical protein
LDVLDNLETFCPSDSGCRLAGWVALCAICLFTVSVGSGQLELAGASEVIEEESTFLLAVWQHQATTPKDALQTDFLAGG